jgi:hypothetical protein
MKHIQDVIANTATPSWLNLVPYNFSDAAAGPLKADEWRTMTTVYIPLALISLWGMMGHLVLLLPNLVISLITQWL